jgi:5-methylcytosine-specific restriction endonuclease McrA
MPDRTCSIDGCDKPHRARDLCAVHYNTQYSPTKKVLRPCTVCGVMVEKGQTVKRRPVCSRRCQTYLQVGHWPVAKVVKPKREPKPAKPPMVERECGWCGAAFMPRWERHQFCSHRCKVKTIQVRRRGRETAAGGTYTWAEVMRLFLAFGKCCAYCTQPVVGQPDPDHVVPISRGGSNSITNILPSCRACNSDKRDLLLSEWAKDRERRGLEPRATDWDDSDCRFIHLTVAA